ncbi:MAG: 50S ribosomal protein L17 [Betaproteobacteria bacterium]|nr:50S ribosomal protein L17 [Betaproteobacteria bacterium]
MRHRHGPRKLNITDGAHRRAMMRHIGCALIRCEQITTTLPRAKELRRFIEPLITLGKTPSVHNRRLAMSRLQERQSAAKLFDDLGVRFGARPGGYVRIIKKGFRKGDNAPMALVEFVEKAPETAEPPKSAKPVKSAKSAKNAKAAKSAKSAKSAKAAKAAKPSKDAKSGESEESGGAKASGAETKTEDSGAKELQQSGDKQ